MMNYLFAIDMDGTLLNDQTELTKETIDVIKEVKELGHTVILASGRSYLGMIDYYNELDLDTPLITLNGSAIYYPDGQVKSILMPKELVKQIYIDLKDYFHTFMINTHNKIYSTNHNFELEKAFNGAKRGNFFDIDLKTYSFDNVYNVVTAVSDEQRDYFENYFDDIEIKARYWGSRDGLAFYDLYLESVSKATAIEVLTQELNIEINKTYTFGDGINDVEMLSLTPNGVAMKNGLEDAKKAANNITAFDNNNSGVAKHLLSIIKND